MASAENNASYLVSTQQMLRKMINPQGQTSELRRPHGNGKMDIQRVLVPVWTGLVSQACDLCVVPRT